MESSLGWCLCWASSCRMLGCFNLLDTEYKMTDDIQAKCIIIFEYVYLNSIYSIYIYTGRNWFGSSKSHGESPPASQKMLSGWPKTKVCHRYVLRRPTQRSHVALHQVNGGCGQNGKQRRPADGHAKIRQQAHDSTFSSEMDTLDGDLKVNFDFMHFGYLFALV